MAKPVWGPLAILPQDGQLLVGANIALKKSHRIRMMTQPINTMSLPPSFLSDLLLVHAGLRDSGRLGPSFLQDLQAVGEDIEGSTSTANWTHEFIFLSQQMDSMRERARARLDDWLKRVPEDDPLLCPVPLFSPMGFGRVETAHTRALAWFIDPKQPHGFNTALIDVLTRLPETALYGARHLKVKPVQSEVDVEQFGRLDILARGRCEQGGRELTWLILIEAKIDAVEGDRQLERYDEWLGSHDKPCDLIVRLFLTKDGQSARTSSNWHPLSFLELARLFRKELPKLTGCPGYHYLRYYISGVLQDIFGWPLPISRDCPDPYAVLHYLEGLSEGIEQ